MTSGNIFNLFWKFVFPSVIGVLVAGILEIIDGFFIGNALGSQGLAGITLAYPPYILIVGIGVLIGTGSSSLAALELGKGDRKGVHDIVNNTFLLCLLAGAVLTVSGLVFCETSISFLGSNGQVLNFAREYLRITFMGSVFMVLTLALNPLVRTDGNPKLCMKIMIMGVITNIVLDYIFILQMGMGMSGAAIATVVSFFLTSVLFTYYLFGNRTKLKLRLRDMELKIGTFKQILQAGLPSFMIQLSLALMLFVYNYILLIYGSELAVSAYGIIGYVCSFFYMLFEGIALGVQPIIGFNYGAGNYERVLKTLRLSIFSCVLIGAFGFILVYMFPESVVKIFIRNDTELMKITLRGMNILMLSLLVEGIVLLTTIYYQSINRVKTALFINLGKTFVLLLPLLILLPSFFGLDGVWSASPAAEYIIMIVVLGMLSKEFKFLESGKEETERHSRAITYKRAQKIEA